MTETKMTPEKAAELRKPFPKSAIGKLPKGGALLDYVGHAAVTDRLLATDPEWTWEPLALDAMGLPALDRQGNLWIRLTVCGVTRIGVGDGKSMKEQVGDALRNAAMRFGVALDLWSKEELEMGGLPEPTPRDWAAEIAGATSLDVLRQLWNEAGPAWHAAITARKEQLTTPAPAEESTPEPAQETLA